MCYCMCTDRTAPIRQHNLDYLVCRSYTGQGSVGPDRHRSTEHGKCCLILSPTVCNISLTAVPTSASPPRRPLPQSSHAQPLSILAVVHKKAFGSLAFVQHSFQVLLSCETSPKSCLYLMKKYNDAHPPVGRLIGTAPLPQRTKPVEPI